METLTEIDCYRVLGITQSATAVEIKKAYREKLLTTHPDKNPGTSSAEFCKVQEAYEILQDEGKRAAFDKTYGDIHGQRDTHEPGESRGQKENKEQWSFPYSTPTPAPEKPYMPRRPSMPRRRPSRPYHVNVPFTNTRNQTTQRRSHSPDKPRARSPTPKVHLSYKQHRSSKSDSTAQRPHPSSKRHTYTQSDPSYNYKTIRPRWAEREEYDDYHYDDIPVIAPIWRRPEESPRYREIHIDTLHSMCNVRFPRTSSGKISVDPGSGPTPDICLISPTLTSSSATTSDYGYSVTIIKPRSRNKPTYKIITPRPNQARCSSSLSSSQYHTVTIEPSKKNMHNLLYDYPERAGRAGSFRGSFYEEDYRRTQGMCCFNSNHL
ncbi:hypothetical protein PAAG_03522 [Paracoccidioides lutzii Pb01]|uniref:J domain-containing protein n=1 Tax=Paracoccidioides lutzii (strain ATCC MYA-826 / Pb01) TaxID=502779 RepID=C1GXE8_PARBA|nr:hypothetical protein PAAG_03522 [Paracoccidioides lutzii Pb01]EEH41236.1 hypothetical protein PAAG_03522 [Paracoccidioides lutzii Pb01]